MPRISKSGMASRTARLTSVHQSLPANNISLSSPSYALLGYFGYPAEEQRIGSINITFVSSLLTPGRPFSATPNSGDIVNVAQQVTIETETPLPGAIWLFGPGLLGQSDFGQYRLSIHPRLRTLLNIFRPCLTRITHSLAA
jgi:hypothetical protein